MFEFFALYIPNLLAALLCSVGLSLVGGLLAARGEALQALVASQSASLGVTIGLSVLLLTGGNLDEFSILPLITAFFFSVVVYILGQSICDKNRSKSSEILISVFLFSLAMNYLITAALPLLESHFSSSFMGDIATASKASSYWLSSVLSLGIIFFLSFWKALLHQSFWISGAGVTFRPALGLVFYIISAILIVESSRIMGFLFTSSTLIVIPLAVSIITKNSRSFLKAVVFLAFLSTLIGFSLSLSFQYLSTSATIVVTQVLLSSVAIVFSGLKSNA